MAKVVTNIVRAGISDFERRHPDWKISSAGRKMLLAHASRHEGHILKELASKETARAVLVRGLRDVLEHSLPERVYRKSRKSLGLNSYAWRNEDMQGRTMSLLIRQELPAQAIRKAMKNKCKTFPWC